MARPSLIGIATVCGGAFLLGMANPSAAADVRVAPVRAAPVVVLPPAGAWATGVEGVEQFGPYFHNPYYGYGLSYGAPYNGVAVFTGLVGRK
jgi:hypothetical protein